MNIGAGRLLLGVLVWILGTLSNSARAHDPGLSSIHLIMKPTVWEAHLIIDAKDLKVLLPDADLPESLNRFETLQPQLTQIGQDAMRISVNQQTLGIDKVAVAMTDRDDLEFVVAFKPQAQLGEVELHSLWLDKLPSGHKQHVSFLDAEGKTLHPAVITAQQPIAGLNTQQLSTTGVWDKLGPMLLLGIEHIWLGFDHVLFLLGLLVVGMGMADAVKIITAFTVSHSLTLGLATFEMVNIPSTVVEPLIAATIVYVGIENVLTKRLQWRWLISFGFGLIHGLGFATALKELGIGVLDNDLWVTLLGFNLGVESGQLVIAALVLPAVWYIRAKPYYSDRYGNAFSLLIAAFGVYWLIERTVLA